MIALASRWRLGCWTCLGHVFGRVVIVFRASHGTTVFKRMLDSREWENGQQTMLT